MASDIRLVDDPLAYKPLQLLASIENDPSAFNAGSRNNDIVNWFFAVRLTEIEDGHPDASYEQTYVDKFEELIERLPYMTRQHLSLWDNDPLLKVRRLYSAYAHINDPEAIASLWVPTCYKIEVAS